MPKVNRAGSSPPVCRIFPAPRSMKRCAGSKPIATISASRCCASRVDTPHFAAMRSCRPAIRRPTPVHHHGADRIPPPMSGSNTICTATVLLETGLLPMVEPVTEFVLESPAGLVSIRADCADGKVTRVTFRNVPGFALHLAAPPSKCRAWARRASISPGGAGCSMSSPRRPVRP